MTLNTSHRYKEELRLFLRGKREKISKKHRKWAKEDCYAELSHLLKLFPLVLSFASFGDEIDLWPLNQELAREGRLALPLVKGEQLQIYQVVDIENQLVKSKWGMKEPNPEKCTEMAIEQIGCILVPGLGFDAQKHRLGYGGGYYDRLLGQIPHIPAFGVGFKEQLSADPLPVEPHDRRLTRLYLF